MLKNSRGKLKKALSTYNVEVTPAFARYWAMGGWYARSYLRGRFPEGNPVRVFLEGILECRES